MEEINQIGLKILPLALIVLMIDFNQMVQQAFIKSLNLQKYAMWIDLIAYYAFVGPLSYFLGFN